MALITDKPPTVFANEAAAKAAAVLMIDAEAGEYFTIEFDPKGTGRCIVKFYEADGYLIATA